MKPHRRFFTDAIESIRAGLRRPAVKRAMTVVQYALLAGVIVYLIRRLSEVGWRDVLHALPISPLFYLVFTLRYFAQPLSEIPAYELVWRKPLWRYLTAFIRKRVYNFAVMGYSGEAFFTIWARRNLNLSDRDIIVGVKDNNLISALISNVATAIMVAVLFFTGNLQTSLDALPGAAFLFALAFLSAASLAVAVFVFRRQIMSLPHGMMSKLMGINTARILFVLALHAALYAAAIPGPPLIAWFVFIALQLVLSRIPFVPNLDIVFLTAALHLAPIVHVADAKIAGMLVAEAGLSQLFNIVLFGATMHLAIKTSRLEDPAPSETGMSETLQNEPEPGPRQP